MRAVRRSSGAVLAVMAALALLLGGCGSDNTVYGAHTAAIGDTQAILGWNIAVANLRFADDRVLVDVTAAPSSEDPDAPAPTRATCVSACTARSRTRSRRPESAAVSR